MTLSLRSKRSEVRILSGVPLPPKKTIDFERRPECADCPSWCCIDEDSDSFGQQSDPPDVRAIAGGCE